MYALVAAYDKDIGFAEQELRGVRVLTPLVNIQHHAWNVRLSTTNAEEMIAAVNKDLEDLAVIFAEEREALLFTESELAKRGRDNATVSALEAAWKAFLATKSDSDWTAFHGSLKTMITHAGDTSNLVLDPDLDSYYVMDVILIAVPTLVDRLFGAARSVAQGADQGQAKVAGTIIRDVDFDRVSADLKTAWSEDPNFFGTNARLQGQVKQDFDAYSSQTMAGAEMLIAFSGQDQGAIADSASKISKTSF
jgi:methyl-accepting chemotaxis protein